MTTMMARKNGVCANCGLLILVGQSIIWDGTTVRHTDCPKMDLESSARIEECRYEGAERLDEEPAPQTGTLFAMNVLFFQRMSKLFDRGWRNEEYRVCIEGCYCWMVLTRKQYRIELSLTWGERTEQPTLALETSPPPPDPRDRTLGEDPAWSAFFEEEQARRDALAQHPDAVDGNRFSQQEAEQERQAFLSDPDYRSSRKAEWERVAKEEATRLDRNADFGGAPSLGRDEVETQPAPRAEQPIRHEIADGTYTVVRPDGSYRTLEIETRTTGNLAGKTIVAYLCGPDNERDFQGCAFFSPERGQAVMWKRYRTNAAFCEEVLDAIRTILQDPRAAGEDYALKSGRCCRCGRKLTVPASLHRGMGPECASKSGF